MVSFADQRCILLSILSPRIYVNRRRAVVLSIFEGLQTSSSIVHRLRLAEIGDIHLQPTLRELYCTAWRLRSSAAGGDFKGMIQVHTAPTYLYGLYTANSKMAKKPFHDLFSLRYRPLDVSDRRVRFCKLYAIINFTLVTCAAVIVLTAQQNRSCRW